MRHGIIARGSFTVCVAALALAVLSAPRQAQAQGKPKAHAAAPRKPTKKIAKKPEPEAEKPDADAVSESAPNDDKPDKPEPAGVKAAGTNVTKALTTSSAAVVKEDKSGVKTYKFGTIEVESRLKSPQIIYFLRRVRAEFDAGALGHRSFMRELSDTRNNPSFR